MSQGPGELIEFRRPRGRELLDLVGPPVGAGVFFVGGLAFATVFPLAVLGFWFFGLLMALSVPASLEMGRQPLLKVSPHGLWTPDMGRLLWSEIAEVRLEAYRMQGAPGSRTRRIGIVPRDPSLRPRAPGLRAAWAMTNAFSRLVGAMAPESGIRELHLAPFGVDETQLGVPLERVIEAISPYTPVVDAQARLAAARLGASAGAASAASDTRLTPGTLRAIDARIGTPAGGAAISAVGRPGGFVAASGRRPDAGRVIVFRRRLPERGVRLVLEAVTAIVAIAVMLWFFATALDPLPPWLRTASPAALVAFAVLIAVFVLAFGGGGIIRLFRAVSAPRRPRVLLEVGPGGIWTPDQGRLGWDEIVDAYIAAGRDDRPRLVLVPHLPEPMAARATDVGSGVDDRTRPSLQAIEIHAADLDGDFDDLVDLLRGYVAIPYGIA